MQRIMVLDIELNQPSRRIIQIGAAVYDIRNATCYDTIEIYVNPGEPISPEITDLTGVTDRDVVNAPGIIETYKQLKDFHKKHKCFINPIVWGSGFRNDSSEIYNQYCEAVVMTDGHGIDQAEEHFMGFRVLDAKTLYQSIQLFENSKHGGGLKESMEKLGLKFEGDSHRALTDARNTFAIWYFLTRKIHDGFKATKK